MLPPDGPIRISIALLLDQGDISLSALVGRASCPARGDTAFFNYVGARNGLGGMAIDSLAQGESPVEGVDHFHRADLGAFPTPGALCFIDKARLAADSHLVIADVSRDAFDFTVAEQADVFVASDGHHFRGKYSGCAVEGRERLIELSHVPANARLTLNHIDFLARICQAQGGFNTRNPSTQH